ncbi:MAG: hypothetical protein HY682_02860 [Chloroflexi bacterium]|nr:hypothetical protein [Chloroflexota bacterium]
MDHFRSVQPAISPKWKFLSQSQMAEMLLEGTDDPWVMESYEVTETLYRTLGLIPVDFDLLTNENKAIATGVKGVYFPDTNEIFVVRDSLSAPLLTSQESFAYAHEYTHFLQDVTLDVEDHFWNITSSDDFFALIALMEGDATLTGAFYSWDRQRPGRDIDVDRLAAIFEVGPGDFDDSYPYFLQRMGAFPYSDGARFAARLLRSGLPTPPPTDIREVAVQGFKAVNRAYSRPPATTEQVLHFSKYLAAEPAKEIPAQPFIGVGDVLNIWDFDSDGWYPVTIDVLGEMFLRAWLESAGSGNAISAAAGWGGDLFALWSNFETNDYIFTARVDWDRSTDPGEFAAALSSALDSEAGFSPISNIHKPASVNSLSAWDGPEGFFLVAVTGDGAVLIIDAPTPALAEDLLAAMAVD